MAFIHVWQAGVYFTDCSAIWHRGAQPLLGSDKQYPWTPSPSPQAAPCHSCCHMPGGFSGKSTQTYSWGFFYSSPATPMLLCASVADFYHYADETERPGFLGNTQACWYIWKMPYCLDAIRKSWLDLVFPGTPGYSDIAKPKGYTGYITAGCVNLPKSLLRWLIQDHCQLCQDLMSQ